MRERLAAPNPMRLGVVVHPSARAELFAPKELEFVLGFVGNHEPILGVKQEVPNDDARSVFVDVVGPVGSVGAACGFDDFFSYKLQLWWDNEVAHRQLDTQHASIVEKQP